MIFRRFLSSTSRLPPTIRQLLSSNTSTDSGSLIEVNGWIKSVRKQKRVAFAVITDGSSTRGLQAVFTDVSQAKSLTNGACVRLSGILADSPGAGQDKELQVQSVDVLGECDPEEYPIQKQTLSTEYLREHCHLRPRTDNISAMLRLRHNTLSSLQEYFNNEGFYYVHTPILTQNDCEGAGETFSIVAPSKASEESSSSTPGSSTKGVSDFFGRPAYLTVSSQLHLEAIAASMSRVYTIAPCFRAERSQTNRHLSEFWMLEAEWAFTDKVNDVCRVVEGAIKHTLRQGDQDLAFLRASLDKARVKAMENAASAQKPWARISYSEATAELEKFQAATRRFEFDPGWGRSLQSEHERWVAEELIGGPVFVTDYPVELKPFYMRLNDDGKTVGCFDLLMPHLGELVGGSLREERPAFLEAALRKHRLEHAEYGWYADLRKYGGAPHGGFGLGFERLISWMSGIENVRECIPMPRWAGRMLL